MKNRNVGSVERQQMLIDAVLLRQYDAVLALLEEGVFVDAREAEHEETALMFASSAKNVDITRLLLERGASVNLQDNRGYSALMHAITGRRIPNICLLIENGADMKIRDNDGETALLHSVASGDIEVVKALLNCLPNPFAHGEGEKALECASSHGYSTSNLGYLGILDLLQKSGAR